MTLEDVGFIHCSTRDQMEATASRFYGDLLDQLVILTIDPGTRAVTDPSTSHLRPGVDTLFPHIYGPLPIAAVNVATHWRRTERSWSTAAL
jgi:uncharacterized protein (DUF952 family)